MNEKSMAVDAEVVGEKAIQVITPMDLIQQAQEKGSSIEQMQQLFELQLRYEENEAKKAFHKAVAAFKAEAIDIIKTKHVSYSTSKGHTEYNHAELGTILNTVTPLMSKHGLSHHWETEQEGAKIKITCFLTHELGYSKKNSLESAKDDSGGKNSIQAIASAKSYLERYTFLGITGLAAREQDDDGQASEDVIIEYISESQTMDIDALLLETGSDTKAFFQYMTIKCKVMIEDAAQIPAELFGFAVKVLEAKRSR